MVESPEQTRDALVTARAIAPEHVHDHPQVLETLDGLTRGRLRQDAQVQALGQWVGEGLGVNSPLPGRSRSGSSPNKLITPNASAVVTGSSAHR
ncbi:hypothetical protein [Phytohabitans rumicis]|uniref:Uncharacterized protein n=1 Tax=Phytohabitans rumicis TaxID=1076125 RepID=A0A6V8LE61_9ACTN|nr:hypothetical protein [Phytohabitans rumicis]GFJ93258.1 hypothetical protein Prum_069000 [Phytohabitans rumicis]